METSAIIEKYSSRLRDKTRKPETLYELKQELLNMGMSIQKARTIMTYIVRKRKRYLRNKVIMVFSGNTLMIAGAIIAGLFTSQLPTIIGFAVMAGGLVLSILGIILFVRANRAMYKRDVYKFDV